MRAIGTPILRLLAGTALLAACGDSPTEPSSRLTPPSNPSPGTPQPGLHLAVAPTLVTLYSGESLQLTAVATTNDGDIARQVAVSWRSGDESVASVSAAGVVHALRVGQTTITAHWGSNTATARVTVLKTEPPGNGCGKLIPDACGDPSR